MELEEKMSRDLAQQRAQQTALLKEKLAQRRKEKMKKLREQQELEKAKVGFISYCYWRQWFIGIFLLKGLIVQSFNLIFLYVKN